MSMRLPARSALALVAVLGLLAPAGAQATPEPEGASAFGAPVLVTPGCDGMLPAQPWSESDLSCGGEVAAPTYAGPTPCEADVIPLVDNRCEEWTARYDGPVAGPDQPHSELGGARLVTSSPDSTTIFAAGTSDSNPSTAAGWAGLDMDVLVTAYGASTGQQRWSFRFPAPEQSYSENVVADPDGDLVYITSADYGEVGSCPGQATTVAVDQSSGALAWVERESTPTQGCIAIRTTAIDPTGELLVLVGTAEGNGGKSYQVAIARDASSGELLWRAEHTSASGETGSAVAFSAGGERVYVAGSVFDLDPYGFPKNSAWAIRGFETATGEKTLATTWNAPLPNANTSAMNPPADMAVSPDGARVYLAGGVEHVPGRFFDITAVALDTATGQQQWMYRYDGPRPKSSFDSVWYNGALAMSEDGSKLAIAGYSTHLLGVNLQLDLVTVMVNTADGAGVWATRYTAENETNWVPSVALSPDADTVYVASPSRYAVQWELPARYTTLAYNAADGSVAWTARYSEGHSFAMGSTLTPDGKRFVVTGMTAPAGAATVNGGVNWDIGLAAYSTD